MLYRTEVEKEKICADDVENSGSDSDEKNSYIAESEQMEKVSLAEDIALE